MRTAVEIPLHIETKWGKLRYLAIVSVQKRIKKEE